MNLIGAALIVVPLSMTVAWLIATVDAWLCERRDRKWERTYLDNLDRDPK